MVGGGAPGECARGMDPERFIVQAGALNNEHLVILLKDGVNARLWANTDVWTPPMSSPDTQ